jgi:hypothetical protein
LHFVADLANIIHTADIAVAQFADMAQTVTSGENFDEATEVFNATDGTVVNLAHLYGSRSQLNPGQRLLSHRAIGGRDHDFTRVLNLDNRLRFFLDRANVLTARTNQHADFFGVNLGSKHSGSER